MFNKPSLKNRFKEAESKLESFQSELKLGDFLPEKSQYPEIHAMARDSVESEVDLSHYLRNIKKGFKRVSIPAPSNEQLLLEEALSETINRVSGQPFLIQIMHPKESKGVDSFHYFISSLKEYPGYWKLLFKDLKWASLSYLANTTVLTVSTKADSGKLESLLKSISTKAGSLVSFSLQKKDNYINIQLRLEAYDQSQVVKEREAGL